MNVLTSHSPQLAAVFNTLVGMASMLLSFEYVRIVRFRKPTYPWLSYATALALFCFGCNRFINVLEPSTRSTTLAVATNLFSNVMLILAAMLIPLVRKGAYHRDSYQSLEHLNRQLFYRQQLFSGFFDALPVIAYIKDARGRITYISRFFADLFQKRTTDVLGKTEFLENSSPSEQQDMQPSAPEHRRASIKSIMLKDNPHTFLDMQFSLPGANNENIIGGIAIDVTSQWRRKNRIDALASIIALSPDATYSYNSAGTVVTWNKAAERLFGYSADEMIGQSVEAIIPPEARNDWQHIIEYLSFHHRLLEDHKTVRIDRHGQRHSVLLSAARTPGPERQSVQFAIVTRNVTKLAAIEESVKSLHSQLEQHVEDLAETNAQLAKARDEAFESSAMKSAFVANISHELRTPLSGILGMTELIAQQTLAPDTAHIVSMLNQSAQALLDVVNRILDLSKLEAGHLAAENQMFALRQAVQDSVELFSAAAANKNLTLRAKISEDVPQLVYGDESMLRQVLLNLIGNAVKFTDRGSVSVSVKVEGTTASSLKLEFVVADTGIGLSETDRQLLFTPFVRVTERGPTLGGLGLGLTITKRFVELMGGTIDCSSELGKGSRFWFTTNFALTSVAGEVPRKPGNPFIPVPELTRYRVLSVDDSQLVSRITMRQLETIGVQAESVATGEEAIDKARSGDFNMILMDINLRDMSGYDTARQIRELETRQNLPRSTIIALTGSATSTDREQALQAGMDDLLAKPASIEQLRRIVHAAISKKSGNLPPPASNQ